MQYVEKQYKYYTHVWNPKKMLKMKIRKNLKTLLLKKHKIDL